MEAIAWRGAKRLVAPALIVLALIASGCAQQHSTGAAHTTPTPSKDVVLTPETVDPAAAKRAARAKVEGNGRVVDVQGAGAQQTYEPGDGVSPGAATDAQVRAELRAGQVQLARFKRYLGTTRLLQLGARAKVLEDGSATAPADAPELVKRVIQAANAIAKFPYKWGGGHGTWRDRGYDCSGSVSFALAGAGLLKRPMTSGGYMRWGEPGRGDWITIYANGGHMFMIVAGLRFDTSGRGRSGTRWQQAARGARGFAVRHIAGL